MSYRNDGTDVHGVHAQARAVAKGKALNAPPPKPDAIASYRALCDALKLYKRCVCRRKYASTADDRRLADDAVDAASDRLLLAMAEHEIAIGVRT
jgi:hypothetical protein